MKNALALERVSTDKQDLQKQGEENEEVRQEHGLNIVDTLRLKGVSGTAMLTHTQVKEILSRLQQPDISGLICPSVDRLFRPKQGSDFAIGNYFQDAGKMLWTKYDGVMDLSTDDGWGRFMEAGVSAGKELRRIRARAMAGKKTKRRLGRNVTGSESLPRGLCYQRITNAAGKTIDHRWFYDDAEVAKIREAYRILFSDHTISLSTLAKRVGWKWGGSLRRCLENPVWRGTRIGKPMAGETEPVETTLPLEAVLTPDQWTLAQTLLAKRRTWCKTTSDPRHLGAGLLVCGECQRRYYTHGDTRRGQHDEYYCASCFKGGPGCGAARLRRIAVDAAIVRIVQEHMTDAKFLAKVFASVKPEPQPDLLARERELAKLAAQRQKWIKQFNADRITEKEFEEQMDALKKATHEVEARMPVTARPVIDQRAVVLGLTRWATRFHTLPFAEQRTALKRVVRALPVVDAAIAEITLSGAFLEELTHTNSEQPSRWTC